MNQKNTFIIFATLLRRFDELHNKANTMHLQASVAAIRGDYDYNNSENWIDSISNIGTENKNQKNIIIIRVYPKSYFNEEAEFKVNIISTSLIVIEITLERLIGHLIYDKKVRRVKMKQCI